jgi:hypothetical protein
VTVELRDEHSRSDLQCQVLSSRPEDFEGMDNAQEKKLRSRKHPKGQSQKERWDDIYKILFPEDPVIPEPCKVRLFS